MMAISTNTTLDAPSNLEVIGLGAGTETICDFGQSCILARSGRKYSEPMSVSLTAL